MGREIEKLMFEPRKLLKTLSNDPGKPGESRQFPAFSRQKRTETRLKPGQPAGLDTRVYPRSFFARKIDS
jgi:hypothetical protein